MIGPARLWGRALSFPPRPPAWLQARAKTAAGRPDHPDFQGRQIGSFYKFRAFGISRKTKTAMIYIPTPSASVQVRIPRTTMDDSDGAVLALRSTVEQEEYIIPTESLEAGPLYFDITGDFSALGCLGEYEYRLTAHGLLLASGVLALGELPTVGRVEYGKTQKYEQYEN